jgi:hypothetical protein
MNNPNQMDLNICFYNSKASYGNVEIHHIQSHSHSHSHYQTPKQSSHVGLISLKLLSRELDFKKLDLLEEYQPRTLSHSSLTIIHNPVVGEYKYDDNISKEQNDNKNDIIKQNAKQQNLTQKTNTHQENSKPKTRKKFTKQNKKERETKKQVPPLSLLFSSSEEKYNNSDNKENIPIERHIPLALSNDG